MTDPTLFEFVDVLAEVGLLRRVPSEFSPRFEVAEGTRQLRSGHFSVPAVLFERVDGAGLPVLTSLYASDGSIAAAFRVASTDELVDRIGHWLKPKTGRGVRDVLALLPTLTRALPWGDSGGNARCQQVVRLGRDVDLGSLPALHGWPAESGPTFTGGLIITRDADGEQTVECGVAEVLDDTTLRVRFGDDSPGLQAWRRARTTERQLDVAISFGGPPALWVIVWLGEILGIDPSVLGEVLGQPQPVTIRGRTVSTTVPAACEMVLEGRIDPEALPAEPGRVASDWGRVTSSGQWATVSIHAVTHAAAAVVPAVVRHEPPHDLSALDRLAERCLERLVMSLVPAVVGLRTPRWGTARQVLLLGVDPVAAPRAREVASAVRGMSGLARAKVVILLDAAASLDDQEAVLSSVVAAMSPERDARVVDSLLDADDPSGPADGSALIIDATAAALATKPRKARPSPSVAEAVRSMLSQS